MEKGFGGERLQSPPDVYELLLGHQVTEEELDDANYNFIVPSLSQALEQARLLAETGVEIVSQSEVVGQRMAIIKAPDGNLLFLHQVMAGG